MVSKISLLAIYTSIALFQVNTYSFAAQSPNPISIPLGHLGDRLTINVGVNGGPPQKYIFDTGSDQFNAVLGQQDTSRLPNVNQAYDYLYGNDSWGGYWLQRKQITSLTYYSSDDNPTPVATPVNSKGYVIGQVEHLLLDHPQSADQKPFKVINGKSYYIDLSAEKNITSGKPTEEKHFYGTFGVGDFLLTDAKGNPNGGSPFATVTTTGFIVAANDNSSENGKTLSPGCAPCSILHLTPSLRAQFDTLVPWAPTRDEGDITHFPHSGAPASSQYEGRFKYAFTLNINGKENTVELPGGALSGAILFDTGNASHVTIDSQKLGEILEKNGVKFSGDAAKTARIVGLTLQPVDINGKKVGNGILLAEDSDQDLLVINKDGSDKKTWNITLGLGFFSQYAVMYDLQNQLTGFSPFFVSADNFSTDANGNSVQLNQITKQMGNLMLAPEGDPAVDATGKKGFLGLAGTISGSGPLALMSDVVVNMTGVNTYTGATYINKGAVLYLSGPGNIANSSRVENNGWFDIAEHGSYYSEWNVPDGMNDVTIRSLSGNGVVTLGDRTLILSQARDNFAGRITDVVLGAKDGTHYKGGLTISGGSQVLSGESDYTGQTMIARGAALHLADTGSLVSDVAADGIFIADGKATGAVTVNDGGLVGGNGRIGTLAARNGGTVSPGNSIGTLTIDNNLTLEKGSRYLAEVEAGRSDLLQVNGQAMLNGGEINVVPGAGRNLLAATDVVTNILTQHYTVLKAGKGVAGEFDSARAGLFLTPDVLYQPNSVTLGLQRNTTRFADVANTPNQHNLAAAIEHLPVNHSVYQSLLIAPSVEQARQAYRQLSGQVHADIASASVNNSRYVRDTLNGRLRQTQGAADSGEIKQDEQGAWVSLLGNWAHASGNENAAGFHDSTYGVLLGADGELVNKWRLGLATGYTRTSLHGNSASADSDNYHLAFYTGKSYDNLNLRAGTAYTWHRIETSRSVGYYGQSSSDKAHYGAGTGQVFAEAGYRLNSAWVNMEPFANLAWVNYKSNGFNEHGGASAVSGESQSTSATLSTLGLRADKRWSIGSEYAVTLRGEMGWQHQYNHPEREVGLRFVGSDATFNTATVAASRDGIVTKASAQVNVGKMLDVSLSYTGLLSENYQDNGITAGLQWRF